MVDFDFGSPYESVPDMYDFVYKVVSVVYHSTDTTWRPPGSLLRDVMGST